MYIYIVDRQYTAIMDKGPESMAIRGEIGVKN
jgi:hypothetical protein